MLSLTEPTPSQASAAAAAASSSSRDQSRHRNRRPWWALPRRHGRAASDHDALFDHTDDADESDSDEDAEVPGIIPAGSCHCFGECCQRCLAHFWFFTVCCGYVVLSSLPRLLVLSDVCLTLVVYLVTIRSDESLSEFLRHDVLDFSWSASAFDLVILSCVRSVILFICFAYRNQTSPRSLKWSRTIGLLSMLFMLGKLVTADAQIHWLLLWSIVIVMAEFAVFWSVRRRRILAPGGDFGRHDYQQICSNPTRSMSMASNSDVRQEPLEFEADGADAGAAFIEVRGIRLHYRLHRHETSPIVLCLVHGFGGGLFSFRQIWPLLAEQASVLAFDRPGYGRSQPAPHLAGPDRIEEVRLLTSEFCVSVMDSLLGLLGIERCIFVGHSSGASVAALMSVMYPARVQALCLASFSQGLPAFLRAIFKTKLGRAVILQLVHSELGNIALKRSWHNPRAVDARVVQRYKLVIASNNFAESLFIMAQAAAKDKPIFEVCKQVTCPVILVDGDDDKLVVETELRRAREHLHHVHPRRVVINHCGHLPHEETPDAFASVVLRFAQYIQRQTSTGI